VGPHNTAICGLTVTCMLGDAQGGRAPASNQSLLGWLMTRLWERRRGRQERAAAARPARHAALRVSAVTGGTSRRAAAGARAAARHEYAGVGGHGAGVGPWVQAIFCTRQGRSACGPGRQPAPDGPGKSAAAAALGASRRGVFWRMSGCLLNWKACLFPLIHQLLRLNGLLINQ